MNLVFLGLSVTSSWGNGHATTYRGLMRGLAAHGHKALFLERDVPWYAQNRDLCELPFGRAELYGSLDELRDRFTAEIVQADAVIVGSYVPQGVAVGQWVLDTARGVTAFYDIDTPVTLAKLQRGDFEYITPALAGRYHLYLSFTGGPTLNRIRREYGAPNPRALYCSVDPAVHHPEPHPIRWDLGYLGTYSDDRQPALDALLLQPARQLPGMRFVVAGPQYPDEIAWPENAGRIEHLSPAEHRVFYNSQRFTLNVTRREMVRAGWSPSVRLFEAAACGVPIISDDWPGLETFFRIGHEILVGDTRRALLEIPEEERVQIGARAREVVLTHHTAAKRAAELESFVQYAANQIAADSPRAHGMGEPPTRGKDTRRAFEPGRRRPSRTALATPGESSGNGAVQQPTGAGARNGGPARTGLESDSAHLGSPGGAGLRRVVRPDD